MVVLPDPPQVPPRPRPRWPIEHRALAFTRRVPLTHRGRHRRRLAFLPRIAKPYGGSHRGR